jgi:hypothetical protein
MEQYDGRKSHDPGQRLVNQTLASTKNFEAKMLSLVKIEPMIRQLHEAGLTKLKPVALMTVDDLVD